MCDVPEGLHPSQVSGMFQDDPTCEEFCEILRQQRAADYQQAQEDVDAVIEVQSRKRFLLHRQQSGYD